LADQQSQEIERLKAERDTARRQAEELKVRSQQRDQQPAVQPSPPPVAQPRTPMPAPTPAPARAATIKELCARSGNVITQGLCEARECLKPQNWNDPFCKQQREASDRTQREP